MEYSYEFWIVAFLTVAIPTGSAIALAMYLRGIGGKQDPARSVNVSHQYLPSAAIGLAVMLQLILGNYVLLGLFPPPPSWVHIFSFSAAPLVGGCVAWNLWTRKRRHVLAIVAVFAPTVLYAAWKMSMEYSYEFWIGVSFTVVIPTTSAIAFALYLWKVGGRQPPARSAEASHQYLPAAAIGLAVVLQLTLGNYVLLGLFPPPPPWLYLLSFSAAPLVSGCVAWSLWTRKRRHVLAVVAIFAPTVLYAALFFFGEVALLLILHTQ